MAFSENLGSAVIDIRAKLDKFKQDMSKATRVARSSAAQIATTMRSAMNTIAADAQRAGIAITAMAGGLVVLTNRIDNIAKAAKRMGLEVEAFQELEIAAALSGAEMTQLETAMAQFTRKLTEVKRGSGNAVAAFDALQQSTGRLIDKSNRQDAFLSVLTALSEIPDETKRAELALELLGARSAASLLPLLDSFEEARKQARESGAIISSELTKEFEILNDELDILSKKLQKDVANNIRPVVNGLIDMPDPARNAAIAVGVLSAAVAVLGGKLTIIIGSLAAVAAGFNKLKSLAPKFDPGTNDPASFFGRGGAPKSLSEASGVAKEELNIANPAAFFGRSGQSGAAVFPTGASINKPSPIQKRLKLPQIKEAISKTVEEAVVEGSNKASKVQSASSSELNTNLGEGLKESVSSSISQALSSGDIKGAIEGFANTLSQILFDRMSSSLIDGLLGGQSSGSSGMMGGIFGGIFGARALGGSVGAGKPYLVGERGPELFVPNSRGGIVPNNQMSGGGVNITMNNNFAGVDAVNRQTLKSALKQQEQQIISNIQKRSRSGGSFAKNLRGE